MRPSCSARAAPARREAPALPAGLRSGNNDAPRAVEGGAAPLAGVLPRKAPHMSALDSLVGLLELRKADGLVARAREHRKRKQMV